MTGGFPFTNPTVAETEARKDRRGGARNVTKRAMPDSFVSFARGKNCYQLVQHYRTSEKVVRRWADEVGISLSNGRNGHPVPDKWEELAAVNTIVDLQRMFNVDRKVIKRWMVETEIEPVPFNRKGIIPVNRKPKSERAFKVMGSPHKAIINTRPRSIWDDAADVLRAERWVVYRSDEKGAANPKGMYWRMGNVILTPDDLLMRADRYRMRAA